MLLNALADRRVVFVSGKGGVGKTSVASALALSRAEAGARVLLISTDPAHNVGHVWEQIVTDDPTEVWADEGVVHAVEVDPEATAERHLATVRQSMRRLLPERLWKAASQHLEAARHAPGTHESAVLERIADALNLGLDQYDLVVFDTAPTGHTVRLMALPSQLTAWTETLLANRDRSERFGAVLRGLGGEVAEGDRDAELRRLLVRRQDRFSDLHAVITDSAVCSFVLVSTAERIPVTETLALNGQLEALGIDVAAVVVNRRAPADAGDALAERRRNEDERLATLRRGVPTVPFVELPWLATEPTGSSGLRDLAARTVDL